MKFQYKISLLVCFFVCCSFAQERTKDTIDNQVVNVIKPYQPSISDAFKIKDVPTLNDSASVKKKPVKYNIFSIPVASTFTPAKGKAAAVDKAKAVKLYDNYASLGFGSYTTILGEVYLNHDISNTETVGGYVSHHSSQGGIDGLLLDDDFLKTNASAYYAQKLRDLSWKVDAGFDMQRFNWYGLPQEFFGQAVANGIDPGHTFTGFTVGGQVDFEDAIVNNGNVRFRRFGDNQDSGENRFIAKAGFNIPIADQALKSSLYIDYLGGSFENEFLSNTDINYGNISVGVGTSYEYKQDDLAVNFGAKLVYLNDTELSENKLFIYPDIDASYRLVNDILIAYAGVTGELIQNSYYDFASENPFVSPTLFVTPTDQQYNGYLGFKGKLSNNVSYNIKGTYISEKSKPLFIANFAAENGMRDYEFGNSFRVTYDDVTTFSVAGELNIDINENFSLGMKGSYFNYDTDVQSEAWNLPDITGSVFTDIQISEQWYAGASVFFVGERKDQSFYTSPILLTPLVNTVTLDSYFDANAHLGYKINDKLSVFGKVNNMFNQDYQRWLNFPVQGIQILAGATYQFDF